MDRWSNRVAVVTGASSGIGAACCKDLVAKGMVVVGLARREDRLKQLKAALPPQQAARFHTHKCDVSVEKEVIDTFAWIDKTLGGADVLVNNAGIVRQTTLLAKGNSADLRATLDTNVLGVSWCTREAFQSMERRKIDDGHILIINSLTGHIVPVIPNLSLNMYPASKHAITALTEVLRQELNNKGTKIKITAISPGTVRTEIIGEEDMKKYSGMPMLRSEDIADVVSYCIQTPPHVQIHDIIIKPINEMF